MTVVTPPSPTSSQPVLDRKILGSLFSPIGRCRFLEEKHFDACTALSGSGPAFCLLVLEAMADGGVMMGLPRAEALELAAQSKHSLLVIATAVIEADANDTRSHARCCSHGPSKRVAPRCHQGQRNDARWMHDSWSPHAGRWTSQKHDCKMYTDSYTTCKRFGWSEGTDAGLQEVNNLLASMFE